MVRVKRILLVEDEKKISLIIEKYLIRENYQVSCVYDGEEAINEFDKSNFDLVLLDMMLPKISGEQVIEHIRKHSDTPVIMVTAKVEEEDRIKGFQLGADDYVIKPFSPKELMERIKAVLRRTEPDKYKHIISYNNGELLINLDNNTIQKGQDTINLTKNEFQIVKVLFSYPNKIFTREEIISSAFGTDYDAYDRAIDSHIKNIRQKIEDDPKNPSLIKTVYGVGYKVGD